jgi:pimeloyl-ACP methyl ester carboxylesterase
VRIDFRQAGSGPGTVVLVPGLGVTGAYFAPLARRLARCRRVLLPDLPGWGKSERPPRPLDIPELAGVLAAFADGAAPGERAAFVGNSLGCQIAIELAVRRPELAGPLVLIGPTVDPRYRSVPRHAWRLVVDLVREPFPLWRIVARDYLRAGPVGLWRTSCSALCDRPEAKLPGVRVPVLVLRGEHDALTTDGWARSCAALAPDGSFATVPATAHAPHFSRPDVVAGLVERFLAERGHGGDERLRRLSHGHVPDAR